MKSDAVRSLESLTASWARKGSVIHMDCWLSVMSSNDPAFRLTRDVVLEFRPMCEVLVAFLPATKSFEAFATLRAIIVRMVIEDVIV